MYLCYSLNNSQGKLKDKKKALSKAINSLHNLIFKSHGNCAGIRKLQRRKKITRKNKRSRHNPEASWAESWNHPYLFTIHKEYKFIPCLIWSHAAHFPKFTQIGPQITLPRAAPRPTAKRAPAIQQVIWVCLKNVWLYFYISALWNPILYKKQRRGVPAAFGWCFCSSNDRKGTGTSRVARPLLYSNRSQFNCIPFRLSCQAWGTQSVPLRRLPAAHCVLQSNANFRERGGGVLPNIPPQILTWKSSVSLSLCIAIHLALATLRRFSWGHLLT